MISVVIADDQTLVRDGFRMILDAQDDIEVLGEAADGFEAVERTRELRPHVVLMDVRMPGRDGLEATRELLRESPKTHVLILTTFDLNEYVYEAMRAGASGFLLKDIPRSQLIEGVRTVARGEALLAPTITKRLIEQFVRRPPASVRPSSPKLDALTAREREVLQLVARGRSNAEIATALYVSDATVKTHVAHALAKLDLRDRVQAVVFAYESGLIEPGDG
jgi:DNA-binding NarL/FixJ family response regulator